MKPRRRFVNYSSSSLKCDSGELLASKDRWGRGANGGANGDVSGRCWPALASRNSLKNQRPSLVRDGRLLLSGVRTTTIYSRLEPLGARGPGPADFFVIRSPTR